MFALQKSIWERTKERYAATPIYLMLTAPVKSRVVEYEVLQDDMINVAIANKKAGHTPLLLNMCDWKVPGGMIEQGGNVQEEECFRRSNYYRYLTADMYPIGKEDAILSSNVEFYCDNLANGYAIYDEPVEIDMVACPAERGPDVVLVDGKSMFADQQSIDMFLRKILMLFRLAETNCNDVLIVSAWGCGAFACPPYHVGKLFRQAIKLWRGEFLERIIIPILGNNYHLFLEGFNSEQ